ncbi:hypothetical protein DPMN_174273 [Dreissena polymorpha]|uniref:Uncharacterized protein n=1 Tax=Dreissena polymorpha TaxID=45954 RepID=A0A9D4IF02_DREPO|nr:hypothetical protein DPMN_174273 [Dreissena polymorpha]
MFCQTVNRNYNNKSTRKLFILKLTVNKRINYPPPGDHVFQQNRTIFHLVQDVITTDVLTTFYEDWKINVTFRVLTSFYYNSHKRKNAPPPGGHFHEDRTINVAFLQGFISHIRKNAPPPGGHVFQLTGIIFELI